jgi:O-antigen ligase
MSFSRLGFAAFLALVVFAQLDAVGNRLSEGLPLSVYPALYALTGLLAIAAWAGDRGTRLAGVPASAVRLALAVLLWAAFSWTLSEHGKEGRDYLTGLFKGAGLLFLGVLLVDSPRRLRLALAAMIVSGLVSALIVYGDFLTGSRLVSRSVAAVTAEFGGIPRSAGGSDENPTTAAHMLLVSIALLAGLFAGDRAARPLAAPILAVCIGALALMAARSALIGLAAALVMLLYAVRRERIFPFLLLAALVSVAAALVLAPTLLDRVTALGNWAQDPTLFRRTTYLAVGFDLFLQSPIWGIGPGNFPLYFVGDEYRYMPGRPPVMRELHNTYADAAVELGIVGLGLFVALFWSALAAARRGIAGPAETGAAGLALLFALVALFLASFFMPNKDMRILWLLLGLAIQCGRLAAAGRAPR